VSSPLTLSNNQNQASGNQNNSTSWSMDRGNTALNTTSMTGSMNIGNLQDVPSTPTTMGTSFTMPSGNGVNTGLPSGGLNTNLNGLNTNLNGLNTNGLNGFNNENSPSPQQQQQQQQQHQQQHQQQQQQQHGQQNNQQIVIPTTAQNQQNSQNLQNNTQSLQNLQQNQQLQQQSPQSVQQVQNQAGANSGSNATTPSGQQSTTLFEPLDQQASSQNNSSNFRMNDNSWLSK